MEELAVMRKKQKRLFILATSILIFLMLSTLFVGRLTFSIDELKNVLMQPFSNGQMQRVIYQLRLPRMLGAVLVGGSLAITGVAYQSVFQNPIASPNTLGAQAGSSFGAAIALFFMWGSFAVTINAFIFGVASILLVFIMSQRLRGNRTLTLILSGMMISSLFSSGTSFLKLIADPQNTLPSITYWLMGSLASIHLSDIILLMLPVLGGSILLFMLRWQLNILTMGDEEAKSLGVSTKKTTMIVLLIATFMTAATVAVSGVIAWVGLVIPHFSRKLIGSDHRYLIPFSFLFGAIFLLIVDTIARMLSSIEIPIGILTAFIGAPLFFYLMMKGEKKV